jgi:F0F1-type ATP synthase membrane subunit c/vacuolar-type H+-ATPase subunit K
MQNEKISTNAFYQNLAIIWFALFSSQFIFLLVIYFIEPSVYKFDFSKSILSEQPAIVIIFAIAAIFNLVISLGLKKKFLAQSIDEQNIHFVQTTMIVGCALCEVVSLLGFMLAFVAQYQYFFIWFALGITGMIFHFPLRQNVMNANYKKTTDLSAPAE